jgi:selenophosphate synthetase-related protein
VAILGKARKDSVIYSSTARPGEKVIMAVDLDGQVHPTFQINFDSNSSKPSQMVRDQLGAMRELGERKLVRAGKDISNPGALGTLGMLLETSRVGARVDLEALPAPDGMSLSAWLKMYPGMGFVVTARPEDEQEVKRVFGRRGLTAAAIGEVTEERKLVISSGRERTTLFDLERESVTGIG